MFVYLRLLLLMLTLNFDPFPQLSTERLTLRRITLADDVDLFALRTDTEVMKYLDRPMPTGLADIHQLINKIEENTLENKAIAWGISLRPGSRLIGTIGFHRIEPENFR